MSEITDADIDRIAERVAEILWAKWEQIHNEAAMAQIRGMEDWLNQIRKRDESLLGMSAASGPSPVRPEPSA